MSGSPGAQLPLSMPPRERLSSEDFLRSEANEAAAALVLEPARWPDRRLALVGPPGAGKTHLAAIAAAEAGVRPVAAAKLAPALAERLADAPLAVVEDVPAMAERSALERRAAEEGLFHLYNLIAAGQGRLLVTGRSAPVSWPLETPDLASRLSSLTVASIKPPDDALLSSVLLKHGADRGLDLAPAAVAWIVCRIERSFAAVEAAAAAIDRTATARRRRFVTQPLAAEALGGAGCLQPDDGSPTVRGDALDGRIDDPGGRQE